jgi:hypothetical protein
MCGLKKNHTQNPKRDTTVEMELKKWPGKRSQST